MSPRFETLDNSLKVILVPCEAESAAFGLFIGSGSRHESAKTAGISHFIEHMLFKGTPKRRAIDITREIEGCGGNFNACTSEEATCFFAHVPDDHLDNTIDVLADMYWNALIDAEEFAREKSVVIEEIKMYSDEPDSVAAENLQRAAFPSSRLGAPVAGSAASLGPMTNEMMKAYIASHYLPSNTIAVAVGNFEPEKTLKVIDRALGGMKRKGRLPKVDFPFKAKCIPEITVAKDVAQTQLAIGYRTFGIGDRRVYAASVIDGLLGRGMSSRLFQEVREKRGLSYDISSRMQFFKDAGIFSITAGTEPKKAERLIAIVDKELKRLCEKRVSKAELERTKEFMVGNFRLSHERMTSKLFYYGQTYLSYGRYVPIVEQTSGVKAVTADDILETANLIFKKDNRSISKVVPK